MSKEQEKFKKLQKLWAKKLEKSGFVDIEQDEDRLKRWDSMYFIARYTSFVGNKSGIPAEARKAKLDATWFVSQQEYYQLAGSFLHEYKFENEKEQLIWDLHSQGLQVIEIYEKLKKTKATKIYLEGIHKIIKRLSNIMVAQCQPKKT